VDEIWLPFPDPQLRISKSNRRLTHPEFLRKYQQILKPGGYINLKTDSPVLYQFTKLVIELYGLTLLEDSDDISRDLKQNQELLIKTHYEGLDIAKSKRIHYLKFALPGFIDPTMDERLSTMVREIETALTEGLKDEKETDRR
jgi:tRNA (guanine-N7-)-methyltransferase